MYLFFFTSSEFMYFVPPNGSSIHVSGIFWGENVICTFAASKNVPFERLACITSAMHSFT